MLPALIANPTRSPDGHVELPTREACEQVFARFGCRVVDYVNERTTTRCQYPRVSVLLDTGDIYAVDLYHGSGTCFCLN